MEATVGKHLVTWRAIWMHLLPAAEAGADAVSRALWPPSRAPKTSCSFLHPPQLYSERCLLYSMWTANVVSLCWFNYNIYHWKGTFVPGRLPLICYNAISVPIYKSIGTKYVMFTIESKRNWGWFESMIINKDWTRLMRPETSGHQFFLFCENHTFPIIFITTGQMLSFTSGSSGLNELDSINR